MWNMVGELPKVVTKDIESDVVLLAMSEVELVVGDLWIDVAIGREGGSKWEMKVGPRNATVYSVGLAYVIF